MSLQWIEKLMGMDDAVWSRHANPLSGWSRVLILPLLALAIWSRIWIGWGCLLPLAAIILFTWLNPRLFPPPADDHAWMTRGVYGERIWLNAKAGELVPSHVRIINLLNFASAIGLIPFAYGLYAFDVGWLAAGLVLTMGAKLWFIDRMVYLYQQRPQSKVIGA